MLQLEMITSQHFRVTGDTSVRDEALKSLVWKHTKHQKNYVFTKAYKDGRWDGKVRLYSPTNIRAGYLEETIQELENKSIEYETNFQEKEQDFTYEEFYKFCETVIKSVSPAFKKKYNIDLELRDYQVQAAWKFLRQRAYIKTGIACHATSAGKSLMISFILGFLFYKKLIEKAVIIVPLQSLVTQFKKDLMDFGFKDNFIGTLYSDSKQINRPITVAMINSTNNLIDTVDGETFFKDTDLVICDEVHKSISKTATDSILSFTNAKYFFGCTGTLPEDPLEKEMVYSLFGEILDERKLKELQETYDAVTNVKVGILNFSYGIQGLKSRAKSILSVRDYAEEVKFLQNDFQFRNPYILNIIHNNFKKGKNIIALVKNIDYGLKLYHKMIEATDKKERKSIYCVDGSMKLSERDEIMDKCKSSKNPYIIFTNFQVFSTGINIRNIDMVVLCDSMKSKITVAQTIGRGVRKSENKNDVLIIDCACDLKYGMTHMQKRKKLYQDEGFAVFEKDIYRSEDVELMDKIAALKNS